MYSFLTRLTRLVLVIFSVCALGCSGKDEEATPVPPVTITGTWELTKQVITIYNADGTVQSDNTYDTYVANNELWRYVFHADGRFEYSYKGQTGRRGTYTHTATNLVLTNGPDFGNSVNTYVVERLTTTELVFVIDSPATRKKSVTTWARR